MSSFGLGQGFLVRNYVTVCSVLTRSEMTKECSASFIFNIMPCSRLTGVKSFYSPKP